MVVRNNSVFWQNFFCMFLKTMVRIFRIMLTDICLMLVPILLFIVDWLEEKGLSCFIEITFFNMIIYILNKKA